MNATQPLSLQAAQVINYLLIMRAVQILMGMGLPFDKQTLHRKYFYTKTKYGSSPINMQKIIMTSWRILEYDVIKIIIQTTEPEKPWTPRRSKGHQQQTSSALYPVRSSPVVPSCNQSSLCQTWHRVTSGSFLSWKGDSLDASLIKSKTSQKPWNQSSRVSRGKSTRGRFICGEQDWKRASGPRVNTSRACRSLEPIRCKTRE